MWKFNDEVFQSRLILSLSNSHNINVGSLQKNQGDKSHGVIAALRYRKFPEPRPKILKSGFRVPVMITKVSGMS